LQQLFFLPFVPTKEEFERAIFNYSLMYHQTRRAAVLPGIKRCFGEFSTAYATHQRVQAPFVLSTIKASNGNARRPASSESPSLCWEKEREMNSRSRVTFAALKTRGMLIRRVINAVV
jgi:hypothetical protein